MWMDKQLLLCLQIVRGPSYSFIANISVEACTNSMMRGDFCNSSVYPLSCKASDVSNVLESKVNKSMLENLVTCKSNSEAFCVHEGVPNFFSLNIMNVAEEIIITATNIRFNVTPSNDMSLMCFVRHGAMPSETSNDYSIDIAKNPLVIHSPLIGLWYISIVPVNLTKTQVSNVRVCYSVESQVLQCPLGKAGPNCTMDSYFLQVGIKFFAWCCHLLFFLYNMIKWALKCVHGIFRGTTNCILGIEI